jgi:hypothetical protein
MSQLSRMLFAAVQLLIEGRFTNPLVCRTPINRVPFERCMSRGSAVHTDTQAFVKAISVCSYM